MAQADALRVLARRHPEIRQAFRNVLRDWCPLEYHQLIELKRR